MILEIISHTPLYVWFVFAFLLSRGWRAKNTRVTSWKTLLIIPVVMSIWSIQWILSHSHHFWDLSLWTVSKGLGIWLGFLTTRKLLLKFDQQRKRIEISGSWVPMILILSIFSLRYFLGVSSSLSPELMGTSLFLIPESLISLVSGMFVGRLIGVWQRSKNSPHTDLAMTK